MSAERTKWAVRRARKNFVESPKFINGILFQFVLCVGRMDVDLFCKATGADRSTAERLLAANQGDLNVLLYATLYNCVCRRHLTHTINNRKKSQRARKRSAHE